MAIGVPRKRQRPTGPDIEPGAADLELQLTYPGKRPAADILRLDPVEVTCLWRSPEPTNNRLYFAENSGVLSALARDPGICGQIRLIYIDPPFATQTAFHSRGLDHAYEDTLAGPDYVEFLRTRLILLHRLLADDGALYLHLDNKMAFHLKIILDEIFGSECYRSFITRKKCNPKNYTRKQYGNVSDYILFYTKTKAWVWNRPVEPWTEGRDREYQYVEPGTNRRFMKVPVHAPGVRRGATGDMWRGMQPPPGKHWQFPPSTLDEMDARGEIFWSANGNPRRKVYLDASEGVGVQDIWMDFRDAHNQNVCITGYPTEKNPDMLRRIIEASSNPGDLVLDCFSGSGTTLAVADQLGRRWIGVDNSREALRTTLKRFADGTTPMGDFVGKRGSKDKGDSNANGNTTLDLFAAGTSAAEETGSEAPKPHHHPIRDFTLWAEHALAAEASPIVHEWTTRISRGGNGVAAHHFVQRTGRFRSRWASAFPSSGSPMG